MLHSDLVFLLLSVTHSRFSIFPPILHQTRVWPSVTCTYFRRCQPDVGKRKNFVLYPSQAPWLEPCK